MCGLRLLAADLLQLLPNGELFLMESQATRAPKANGSTPVELPIKLRPSALRPCGSTGRSSEFLRRSGAIALVVRILLDWRDHISPQALDYWRFTDATSGAAVVS